MKPTLFIADLHLSDETPDLNALFAQFLRDHAHKAAALYILGDLFEVWTGDDDPSQTAATVAQHIYTFSQNAPVYFMAGNRDFLLGKEYARRANLHILPEPTVIECAGKRILLTHGDELCTEDVRYLRYRRIIRWHWVKWLLLHLPYAKRQRIAARLRAASRQHQARQTIWADVTEAGVQAAWQQFAPLDAIVHGHTHRPNIHQHGTLTRYVLPDWYENKGGYLRIDEHGAVLINLPE